MTALRGPPPADHRDAIEQYRRRAPYYDVELALLEPIRRDAIERLAPRRGDTVFDIGCGTGLSLPLLHERVGARGRIVGVEQCPAMLERARERVREHGWRNVTLIEASAEEAAIDARGDAALFHFTHDILRTPAALDNVLTPLRGGAPVVACGLQWASPWLWPMNLFVLGAALHSVSSLEGLQRPWQALAERLDDWQVTPTLAGAVFIASGRRVEEPR